MYSDPFCIDYNEAKSQCTGSHDDLDEFKILIYPFGKYEIKVKLTLDNKFLDIIEIKINKDFLSHKLKSTPKGYHDVEKYYSE